MSEFDASSGPIDLGALEVIASRADSHPLVVSWQFEPNGMSPRRLALRLDPEQYPEPVTSVRIDVRWYEGGDYTFHYVESRFDGEWQCRWDRHPKPEGPRSHFHPPPDADSSVEPSGITEDHHLGVVFAVLDWVEHRVDDIHGN